MHFRTAMCGGEPCSGSSGTARNFWRAGSLGSRSFPVRAAVMRPASGAAVRRFRQGRRRARDPVIPARRFAGRPMLAARAGLVPGLPLMHPAFYIRPARVEEAAALSDLCFRSKAVWGYDPEFMALMLAALGVAGEDIAAGDVWVATGADGQIAGVVALAPGDAPGALDLNKLFIEPRHIRSGVGRALLAHAIAEARRRSAGRLTILADPNAAAFYERAGAVRIGEAPSDAVPGRLLPLL